MDTNIKKQIEKANTDIELTEQELDKCRSHERMRLQNRLRALRVHRDALEKKVKEETCPTC